MLTVGKFAFNRAHTRHQEPEYPRENLSAIFLFLFFAFSLSIFFRGAPELRVHSDIAKRLAIILRTYRVAPIRDGSSRSSADDVSRV